MHNQLKKFLETICETSDIKEPILEGFSLIFEGINDIGHVFDADIIINSIIDNFLGKYKTPNITLEINKDSFKYSKLNGSDPSLNVTWLLSNKEYSRYNIKENMIYIGLSQILADIKDKTPDTITPIDSNILKVIAEYDGTPNSVVNIIKITKPLFAHEYKHYIDVITHRLNDRKYTKLSELENGYLAISIQSMHRAIQGIISDKYTIAEMRYSNQQTEINAHINELIYNTVHEYLLNPSVKKYDSYDKLLSELRKTLNTDMLTTDSKRRIYKRLYVFYNAMLGKSEVIANTTYELRNQLIEYFFRNKTMMESIDYSHNDILTNRNISIFEANYKLDPEYKKWFDSKYCKNGQCIVSSLRKFVTIENTPKIDCDEVFRLLNKKSTPPTKEHDSNPEFSMEILNRLHNNRHQ